MLSAFVLYALILAWIIIESYWLNSEIGNYKKKRNRQGYERRKYVRDKIFFVMSSSLTILGIVYYTITSISTLNSNEFFDIFWILMFSLTPVVILRFLQEHLDKKDSLNPS